jgi:hypothetical protein
MSDSYLSAEGLETASSLYLQKLASGPVGWRRWSAEAFEAAQSGGKAVLLSIGRSGCLLSKKMDEDVFEDEDTAAFLNRNFVCIKIDSDERPDIASIYGELLSVRTDSPQSLPLTVFVTPDRLPFFGGNYFPQSAEFGLPSFLEVCASCQRLFTEERGNLHSSAEKLLKKMNETALGSSLKKLESDLSDDSLNLTKIQKFLGGATARLNETFRTAAPDGQKSLLQLAGACLPPRLTAKIMSSDKGNAASALNILDMIRCSGLSDPVAGGVFDGVPEERFGSRSFKKSLAENAQMMALFVLGSAAMRRGNPEKSVDFLSAADEVFGFMTSRLRSVRSGLFFSSDIVVADGQDTCACTYSFAEFTSIFNDKPDELDFALSYFGLTKKGNLQGRNILSRPSSLERFCQERAITVGDGRLLLESCLATLRSLPDERVQPVCSGLILLSDNALFVTQLLNAAQVSGSAEWFNFALTHLDKVWSAFFADRETPVRLWSDEGASGQVLADDLAFSLQAFVAAYCATGKAFYAQRARRIVKWIHSMFVDPVQGVLYSAPKSTEYVRRPVAWQENTRPSCAAVIFESCRTFLAVCSSAGTLDSADPSDVKMWEALELVALATFAAHARLMPELCTGGLSALGWAVDAKVCIVESDQNVVFEDWLKASSAFWAECLAAGGARVILCQRPEAPELAAGSEPSETSGGLPALVLCTARGRYESTANYSEIIGQILAYSDSES